ncbi:MAG TPA: exo-beta-N-acetylmuramidase NamZ domain-containing protein, partial [Acidobacteriota bacterium]|nr:exo-beta-N-acetylmuramidase NamZ domain-containing protein [Acidobacteriota bacterium]
MRRLIIAELMLFVFGLSWALIPADQTPRVLNGIDVLRQQGFTPLAGKRVGLITNHTGLAADGTSTIDLLYKSKVCKLVALFCPEHGIRGVMDSQVDSSVDEA